MQTADLFFVIPTYRLRDVGETVEHYDEHFWRNGHSLKMIVFDDSQPGQSGEILSPRSSRPAPTTSCITSARGRRNHSSPI